MVNQTTNLDKEEKDPQFDSVIMSLPRLKYVVNYARMSQPTKASSGAVVSTQSNQQQGNQYHRDEGPRLTKTQCANWPTIGEKNITHLNMTGFRTITTQAVECELPSANMTTKERILVYDIEV
ncbi:hypothetical protein HAX54_009821 [Datura stramonium]|uniref:Uncharacterized protein n=1 Tax=Datura stramonium TaxID=4076 RepID=A0ABS8WY97_DATST|nr:hypothetical protein [Datura stramonium]